MCLEKPRYPLVKNSVVVVVLVTSITLAISIKVFLSRVGKVWTVILKMRTGCLDKQSLFLDHRHQRFTKCCEKTYLFAVISGICTTHKVLIGPAVQVGVLSTQEAISSVTGPTLALVHWVTEVTDVDALSIFVTVVGLVLARVFWFTDLNEKHTSWYTACWQQIFQSDKPWELWEL